MSSFSFVTRVNLVKNTVSGGKNTMPPLNKLLSISTLYFLFFAVCKQTKTSNAQFFHRLFFLCSLLVFLSHSHTLYGTKYHQRKFQCKHNRASNSSKSQTYTYDVMKERHKVNVKCRFVHKQLEGVWRQEKNFTLFFFLVTLDKHYHGTFRMWWEYFFYTSM